MTNKIIYSVNFLKEVATDLDDFKAQISNLIGSGILQLGYPDAFVEFEDSDAHDLPPVNGKIQLPPKRELDADTQIFEINIHTLLEMEKNLFGFNLESGDQKIKIAPYIDFRASKIKANFKVSQQYLDSYSNEDEFDPTEVILNFNMLVDVDSATNTLSFNSFLEGTANAVSGGDDFGRPQFYSLVDVGSFNTFNKAVHEQAALPLDRLLSRFVHEWVLKNQIKLVDLINNSFLYHQD